MLPVQRRSKQPFDRFPALSKAMLTLLLNKQLLPIVPAKQVSQPFKKRWMLLDIRSSLHRLMYLRPWMMPIAENRDVKAVNYCAKLSYPVGQSGQFQPIEQPLINKAIVTSSGLGLMGLELWWFLRAKPKSCQVTAQDGIQAVTVTVDDGYEPSQIVVQSGQLVRLNFDLRDPSHYLEEVRIPDFRIAQKLILNQITPIEFIPDRPGRYEFSCSMNMFRGVIEVQAGDLT